MVGLHSYVLEIDPDYYKNNVHEGVEIYEPYRGGMAYHNKPCHGRVIATLHGSPVSVGDTLFYVHARLYDIHVSDGKSYIQVESEFALGYCKSFPEKLDDKALESIVPIGLEFIVADRIKNHVEKTEVVDIRVAEWLPRVFNVRERYRKLSIKKGDRVWTFRGSEYFVPYLPHIAFLRPEYITFNETQNNTVGEFCMVGVKQMGFANTDGMVLGITPPKIHSIGVMLSHHKTLRKGDVIRFHPTGQQVTSQNPMVYTPRYNEVISKFHDNP